MEMILVRHAEPIEQTTSDGSPADPPLSRAGEEQANAVASWLTQERLDRVISSPALRARATAEPVAERAGVEVLIDDRLCDANAGRASYVPLEAAKARDREGYQARIDSYLHSPQLERISQRVNQALGDWAERCAGERVAVFCHGSVVNVFAAGILGLDSFAFLEADYASGHRFLISRGGVRSVRSLNETAYLRT